MEMLNVVAQTLHFHRVSKKFDQWINILVPFNKQVSRSRLNSIDVAYTWEFA